MDKSRSRDDFFASRNLHAAELDARFLELVEKSGLTLNQRGTAHAVRCMGWRMSDGQSAPMLAFTTKPQELTLVSSLPLEEGQRLILKRSDRLDKDRISSRAFSSIAAAVIGRTTMTASLFPS
ncbi:MAG: hypothetical protein P3W87_002340 [Gammaproteobacteria bacterium]|nr:hypothetical protein [Gammaproteobacteria bacterium]